MTRQTNLAGVVCWKCLRRLKAGAAYWQTYRDGKVHDVGWRCHDIRDCLEEARRVGRSTVRNPE